MPQASVMTITAYVKQRFEAVASRTGKLFGCPTPWRAGRSPPWSADDRTAATKRYPRPGMLTMHCSPARPSPSARRNAATCTVRLLSTTNVSGQTLLMSSDLEMTCPGAPVPSRRSRPASGSPKLYPQIGSDASPRRMFLKRFRRAKVWINDQLQIKRFMT